VIGDGWPNLTRGRAILLTLALLGLGYLLLQTNTSPVQISTWRGNAAGSAALFVGGSIAGEAQMQGGLGPAPGGNVDVPFGNPLAVSRTVLTQGYGVGSHAPASIWGGLDLAVDGDGDGAADPEGTWDMPVYATHNGIAQVRPNTWPGGNYIAVTNSVYKTAYAHLARFAVIEGQPVARGQIIGYVGSTGQSSGPHLHYEVWENGVNRDPTDFGALEGIGR
jgi:murein DD-endopeptidase MepM/ murein hydrolase activator NlpD